MLSSMEQTATTLRSRRRDEKGTSLVEFSLIVTLLGVLLLGIIVFGMLLSKRQVLTQATAEGARAAVAYQYSANPLDTSLLEAEAENRVNESLEAIDRTCNVGPTTCDFDVYPCGSSPPTPATGSGDCLVVTVEIDVKGSDPLVPSISVFSPFLPSTMSSKFTVTLANQT